MPADEAPADGLWPTFIVSRVREIETEEESTLEEALSTVGAERHLVAALMDIEEPANDTRISLAVNDTNGEDLAESRIPLSPRRTHCRRVCMQD